MNDLIQLIQKTRDFPGLAQIYAIEIDRQLHALGKDAITFSAQGLAEGSLATARTLGIDNLFTSKALAGSTNAIYEAEMLIKEGRRTEALAHAFANAQGPQINGLNLFFANYSTQNPEIRRYYLNKYLSIYDLSIDLEPIENATFFHRLKCSQIFAKVNGPLVTVIMPAHNAASTIELAVNSLLNQSWQNLQIIIVDDASTDTTLHKAKAIAQHDPRVEVLSNPISVGAYVSRNHGVLHSRGQWLTVHDADVWAFPDRIEQQVSAFGDAKVVACTGGMLRMNSQGQITHSSPGWGTTDDGYQRWCNASLMVLTKYFQIELGAWDSVRIGGDAELIERLKVLGVKRTHLKRPLMLCLDQEDGLTNHAEWGFLDEIARVKKVRSDYKKAYQKWHQTTGSKKLSLDAMGRPIAAPKENQIDQSEIGKVLAVDCIKSRADTAITTVMTKLHRVLVNANEIAITGDHARAIALAEAYLPANLAYTAHILRANAAIAAGDEAGWLRHINAFLAEFDVAPIRLEGEGSIFNRLACGPLTPVTSGPLITVIMPVWNSEKTVRKAADSILNQTWRNLELLIVDDLSTDGTWAVLQEIASKDKRVHLIRNKVNVGPYVSKNIALLQAKGDWITGQDADDWSLPQRIERHLSVILNNNTLPLASLSYMVRLTQEGCFSWITEATRFTFDGVSRKSSISLISNRDFFINELGSWDCVRFGADSETIDRARRLLGTKFLEVRQIGMLCLQHEGSLTGNPEFGVSAQTGVSIPRTEYKSSWMSWHQQSISAGESVRLNFPSTEVRYFPIPAIMEVPYDHVMRNLVAPYIMKDCEPVTAICVSRRREFLTQVRNNLKQQTYPDLRVIYVIHGDHIDIDTVERELAELKRLKVLQLTDRNTFLADGLNLALDFCDTDLCAKIDDDDHYGPNYILNAQMALKYSGVPNVALVGKATHFCYIESRNAFGIRFPNIHNRQYKRVHGGTLFWRRSLVGDQRFERVRQGTDSLFTQGVRDKGLIAYSADPFDFIHVRYANSANHTWQIDDEDFMRPVKVLAEGLRHELAYSHQGRSGPI